jgi:hypothetical protein|tara:strand:- start:1054 stop:1467 length:414 start_codon:yes stop_codon:yes gene_type:complete
MANEAVIIELLGDGGDVVQFTVADGAGIEKGTLMQISSDPRTITASSADGEIFVGVAAAEKVASDGSTTLGVYTHGIFDMTVDGTNTATLGNYLKLDGANLVSDADEAGAQGVSEQVGMSLETGATSEVIAVWVRKP